MSVKFASLACIGVFLASSCAIVACGGAETGPQVTAGSNDMPAEQAQDAPNASTPSVSNEPSQPAHLVNPPEDPRSALSQALASGLLVAEADDNEKLAALLRTAGVAESSQVLVFTKTSLQHRLISPTRPRAIYFNDDCYIGFVPGGLVEYGDSDPKLGSGLLKLDLADNAKAALETDSSCLSCHSGARTNYGRGFLVRSVFPDERGHPITSAGSTTVGHDTPIEKRWGGWYVTGTSGKTHHRGNQTTKELEHGDASLDNAKGSNVTDLSPYFRTDRYLKPTSDIVALMVLEHQVVMHNLLTQGMTSVRKTTKNSRLVSESLGETFDPAASDTLQSVIRSHTNKIVKHMLFSEEVALTEPVVGDKAYQHAFRANRKEDKLGRSLKDFDLKTRMFKHRCSYMVYSRAFALMPPLLKDSVLAKLKAVLTGNDPDKDGDYQHLSKDERKAILTILQETGVL